MKIGHLNIVEYMMLQILLQPCCKRTPEELLKQANDDMSLLAKNERYSSHENKAISHLPITLA